MARSVPSRKCAFCSQSINLVDYKNARLIGRYQNAYSKIEGRRRSGNCAKHQRMIARAVKRARLAALVPFTTR